MFELMVGSTYYFKDIDNILVLNAEEEIEQGRYLGRLGQIGDRLREEPDGDYYTEDKNLIRLDRSFMVIERREGISMRDIYGEEHILYYWYHLIQKNDDNDIALMGWIMLCEEEMKEANKIYNIYAAAGA